MAIYNYKKYQVLLQTDSKKTQGLQTGDIVRRQYFDGKQTIYSLMCVVDYGTERMKNDTTGLYEERKYFIGALLEGDAPQNNEILDFARITNLFDTNRSGALYLTASDADAPFIDVVDGIGRNKSLSWPESVATSDFEDPESQYVVRGTPNLSASYDISSMEHSRVLTVTRMRAKTESFEGLQQNFYQFVKNPDQVLISYKVRGSVAMKAKATLGYADGTRIDGEWVESITTDWTYCFRVVTVDYSGRHLRSFKLALNNLVAGEEVQIADFNIILLSSVANFKDASAMRMGKLAGVVDPVFGTLQGYGAYLQKLYAAHAAHVSGTLTAGDENGFGSTFYAGKIHRNSFLNSLDIKFSGIVGVSSLVNPTGIGKTYEITTKATMTAQKSQWLSEHAGQKYCFSFWVYATQTCQITIHQNDKLVNTMLVPEIETDSWRRLCVAFDLEGVAGQDLLLSVTPAFQTTSSSNLVYFAAPQLEPGVSATQYQPTDDILNFTEDYGAWFNRGGIGGTIQNPLLKLNFDDQGSIGTRSNSFVLRADGSGYLANKNISWGADGKVVFGDNVTLNWDNLNSDFQQAISSKGVKITGEDTFTVYQNTSSTHIDYFPDYITLSAVEENIESTSNQRKWYCLFGNEWCEVADGNNKSVTIYPDDDVWGDSSSLALKYEVTTDSGVYVDTFTVRKQHTDGYSVQISSTQGEMFKNGNCSTTLKALVYFQGNLLNSEELLNLTFDWKKYTLPDMENEDTEWFKAKYDDNGNLIHAAIDTTQQSITLNYRITSSDVFVCDVGAVHGFPYTFPIVL